MKKIPVKCIGVLLGTLVVVCLSSCAKDTAYYVEEEAAVSEVEASEQSEVQKQEENSVKPDIYVYVCGQVQTPGVYVLPEGSRVFDVFKLAGGLTAEAAPDYWNQAQVLKDGEMLYVPTAEEAKERKFDSNPTSHTDTDDPNKVNINTASKEELMTIPGVGEAKALAILAYRQENGPFSSIEELMNVEGIKDGVFSKMKEYIEVN